MQEKLAALDKSVADLTRTPPRRKSSQGESEENEDVVPIVAMEESWLELQTPLTFVFQPTVNWALFRRSQVIYCTSWAHRFIECEWQFCRWVGVAIIVSPTAFRLPAGEQYGSEYIRARARWQRCRQAFWDSFNCFSPYFSTSMWCNSYKQFTSSRRKDSGSARWIHSFETVVCYMQILHQNELFQAIFDRRQLLPY